MLFALSKAKKNYNLVHIGNRDQISVLDAAKIILRAMKLKKTKFNFAGGKVGWKGDVASNFIASESLNEWGWKPPRSSAKAIFEAASRLALKKVRH